MIYKTGIQLVSATEQMLYQAAGSAVQSYSQTLLLSKLQDAFDHLFLKEWWPHFTVRKQLTVANGLPTTPLQDIVHYEDIRYVYTETRERPLAKLQLATNTLNPVWQAGGVPRAIEHNPATMLRFWPSQCAGTVLVVGRARPAPYLITQTFELDSLMLSHFAVWSYFTEDAANPDAANMHQAMFTDRYVSLKNNLFNEPIDLDPNSSRYPDTWTEGWL